MTTIILNRVKEVHYLFKVPDKAMNQCIALITVQNYNAPNSFVLSLNAAAEERISVHLEDSVEGILGGIKLIGSQRTCTTDDFTGDILMIIMKIIRK